MSDMTESLAVLGLEVRSDGVVVASERLRELEKQAKGAADAADDFGKKAETAEKKTTATGKAAQEAANGMRQMNTATGKAVEQMSKMLGFSDSMARMFRSLTTYVLNAVSGLGKLRVALMALATTPLGILLTAGSALAGLWLSMKSGTERSKELAEEFDKVAASMGKMAAQSREVMLLQVNNDLEKLAKSLPEIEEKVRKAGVAFRDWAFADENGIEHVNNLERKLAGFSGIFGSVSESVKMAAGSLRTFKSDLDAAGTDMDRRAAAYNELGKIIAQLAGNKGTAQLAQQVRDLAEQYFNATHEQAKWAAEQERLQKQQEYLTASTKDLTDAVQDYAAIVKSVSSLKPISFDGWQQSYDYLMKNLEGTKALKDARKNLTEQNMQSAMAEAQKSVMALDLQAKELVILADKERITNGMTATWLTASRAAEDAIAAHRAAAGQLPVLQKAMKEWLSNTGSGAGKAATELNALQKSVDGLRQSLVDSLPLVEREAAVWAEYEKAMAKARGEKNKNKRDLMEEEATLRATVKLNKLLAEGGKGVAKSFSEAENALKDFEREYQSAFGNSRDLTQSIIAEMDKFRQAAKVAYGDSAEKAEELRAVLERIDKLQGEKLLQSSREWGDGITRAFKKFIEETQNLGKQAESIFTSLFNGLDNAGKSMWQSLIENGKLSMSSLKSMFNSFLAELMHMAVSRPIMVSIAGSIAGIFGGTGTANAGGNILSSLLGGGGNQSGGGIGLNNLPIGQMIPQSWKDTASGWANYGTSTVAGWMGYGPQAAQSAWQAGYSSGSAIYGSAFGEGSAIGAMLAEDAAVAGMEYASASGAQYGSSMGMNSGASAAQSLGSAFTNIGAGIVGSMVGSFASPYVNKWVGVQNNKGASSGIGYGAAAGGTIGSFFGPIGTAVGAAIGAIVGGIAGGIAGKERQSYVYGAMRTNLVDPGAYTNDLGLRENSQALADAFGDTARNLAGDWNAIDLKGTTGHSAYYVDPVHAGGSSRKIAASLEPAMLEMETMVLEIANTIRDSLPTDELKKNLDAYNMENALVLEYKTKGGNINAEGMEYWANYWAEQTQEHLLNALNSLDWSEYEGKIKVDTSTWEGYERFLAGAQAIEEVKKATEELVNPTSEWITQAKAANAQLDEWAYALRQYGVETEYAAQLMDEYRSASVTQYVDALRDAITPASQLSQAMKALQDDMTGRIEGLKILEATEAQVAQATVVMNQALADLKASLSEPFHNDLRVRALTVAGGDVAGEQLRQSHVSQRVSAIATFGEDSTEYANLLLTQEAEAMKHQADLAQAEYEKLAASLDGLAQTAKDTAGSVESARLALVTELVNAERTARNGIKEAVDAWVDAARSAFDSAANTYVSALQTSLSTFQAIANQMRSLQQSLWTDTNYTSQGSVYASSRSELDRLYALAAEGDKDAASSFSSMAKTYLDASKATATDFGAYQNDFYAVQSMISSLEDDANSQAASLQSELDLLNEQLGLQSNANKNLDELRDEMESARAVLDRARTEQTAAYERWGFEAVVPGIEGLELAYREKVDEWIAADAALNDALLSGLTTQMEIDSLRISSSLDTLLQAYRDAEAASASAQAEYASSNYQSMSALEQARKKAESLAQQALDLATKAQEQIAATGGFAGSRFASEHELLQAKANALNTEGYTNAGISTWTVSNLKDYMLNVAKLSVPEWYERHGKIEGFATGGLASGWAMVGEQGPELVNFTDPGRVYTADQTRRMLAPAASDGSYSGMPALIGELRRENEALRAELRAAVRELRDINRQTSRMDRNIDDIQFDGIRIASSGSDADTLPNAEFLF